MRLLLLLLPGVLAAEIPYPFDPVEEVTVAETDFWHPRLETNRRVTVWHDFEQCETTGRLDNFRKAAGEKDGFYQGLRFDDSDVHKVIEGAARILGQKDDPKLAAYLDRLIATFAEAQEDDGYLYTVMQVAHDPVQPVKGIVFGEKWRHERESHETYCMGHLIEAGAVHFEQTGKRPLLDVAINAADCIDAHFGPGKLELPSGHQQIEIGLMKLYEVTGETRYADLSHWFLEQRGRISGDRERDWGAYFQDHKPVAAQDEAVGHAVRAAYQYMAMADVAVVKDIQPYRDALHSLWDNVAEKKLYPTGGIGGGSGEGFSGEYQLPNLGAYNETCSSIANILWQQRMFQLEGDARYVEILERCLYNSFLSGISMEGDAFFYPNKLTSPSGHSRSPWFRCACCPPNVVRFLPQVPSLAYATHEDTVHVNLYGSHSIETEVAGENVKLTQKSRYPWDGKVEIVVGTEADFTLALRLPGWLEKPFPSDLYRYADAVEVTPTLTVAGETRPLDPDEKGYIRLAREWKAGDRVVLDLPMPVRRVVAHPKVDACRNRVALMRGPIVYAAEGSDNDGHVHHLIVPSAASFTAQDRPDLLGGVVTVAGKVEALSWNADATATESTPHELTAIPYYAWAHRGRQPMRVWLATAPEAAWPESSGATYTRAKITTSGHNRWTSPAALNDGFLPQSSSDQETPRFLWDDTPGAPVGAGALEGETTQEDVRHGVRWVQYDFPEPVVLRESSLYWFVTPPDSHGKADLPTGFRLLHRQDGQWLPIETDFPTADPDQLQTLVFPELETTSLRLEVTPRKGATAGLLEWIVR